MSEVLSQNEIDALLNAISSGELDTETQEPTPGRVHEYDFRTANRFHKEQIRTLNIIYDTFGRLLSSYLSGALRAMCTAEVVSVEELKYQEFINSLPSPVTLAVVRMPPLAGSMLIEMSPDLCYSVISRLLGGTPDGTTARTFTEIELVLLERIMRQFIPLFVESWEKVAKVTTILDRIETSAQFAQIVALNETIALITLNVRVGQVEGLLNICLPHLALEPVTQQLSTKFWYQTSQQESREFIPATDDIRKGIERTPLGVTAVFNDTTVSVRDILNLQAGDVIPLDHRKDEPLTLKVGHLPKFRAAIGIKDKRYAVKIADFIRKEDANDE